MQSLARPRAPMGSPDSKTLPAPTPKAGRRRPGVDPSDVAQAAAGGAAAGRLGTTAESGAALGVANPRKAALAAGLVEFTDSETGEILTLRRAHDCSLVRHQSPAEKRLARWQRKAAAVSVLGKRHRIAACHSHPTKGWTAVEVWAKSGAALPGHFKGLQTCSLSWLCPVCAAKIAERRAGEIESAMVVCKAQGGQVLMPTFTVPHGRKDPLIDTLDLIKKALRSMGQSRRYRQLQDRLGVVGRVIATEITHGEANGWHPHFHELWFFESAGVDVAALESELFLMWRAACIKFGLGEPSRKHGVVVQDGSKAAAYVSKMGKEWGLADEMAKANVKAGRKGSRSAWQLLDCILDADATPAHQKRAHGLFREYADATKGRSQLVWTPGLKKRYAIADLDDAELCAQVEEDAVLIAQIPLDVWRLIRLQGMQVHILNAVQHGAEAVNALIEYCRRTGTAHAEAGLPA